MSEVRVLTSQRMSQNSSKRDEHSSAPKQITVMHARGPLSITPVGLLASSTPHGTIGGSQLADTLDVAVATATIPEAIASRRRVTASAVSLGKRLVAVALIVRVRQTKKKHNSV